jgi:uncharacterized Zn-binding protein involved in type VI secretion
MGQPSAIMGDAITAQCTIHLIPGAMGAPQPGPPMPFSAKLTQGLATTVFITGRPAAVQGSSGLNLPPHVGLHPSDPFMIPAQQMGRVLVGSPTVLIEGKGAARGGSSCSVCTGAPAQLTGGASSVLVA